MTSADLAALASIAAVVWLAGCVLLALLNFIPRFSATVRSIWPLMLSEAAILAGGTVTFLLPEPLIIICLIAAAARIGLETAWVFGMAQGGNGALRGSIFLAGLTATVLFVPQTGFAALAITIVAAALAAVAVAVGTTGGLRPLLQFFLFPSLPLACFVLAARHPELRAWLVAAFLLVELFDSMSLLAGRLFGRTPLIPRISPRKTVEGLGGGILFTAAGAAALSAAFGLSVWMALILLIVVVLAAVTGDLTASAAKRRADVKDYPPILIIQGGLTDIVDAWLVTGPVLIAVLVLIGA